jgi:PKHD-type hydroxylase
MQSLVRSAEQRRILYDLDMSIQALSAETPNNAEIVRLSGVYHNLLRQWSET